ncbi:MAG TPA: glycosyltransferase family 2 protein [Coleofasciculaceae cyanobacterium]|jgi:GT2 family glycosyltransferase
MHETLHSPLVYILLLNYRGTDDTLACLDSLRALDYPDRRIVVIDNASPDNAVERLQARLSQFPGEFHFIQSSQNLGFSGGNNLGIRYALEEAGVEADAYIWLLNNDTTIAPDALTHLVQESQKTGGLVGSLLLYPDGGYQQVGTHIRWWTGGTKGYRDSEIDDGMPVETLTGASLLIPFKSLRAVGLLEEQFFLYFEDGEYSLRCARQGFPLTIALKSKVFHKEGATTGRKSLNTQYYYHRNRMILLQQYANPLQWLSIQAYTAFRMLRTGVKSLLDPEPERKLSAKVQWIALRDYYRGVRGPCPHNLESLR